MTIEKITFTENLKRNHHQLSKILNTIEANKAKAKVEQELAKQKQA